MFPVSASLILSEVILDFSDSGVKNKDITVRNAGKERYFVSIEPFRLLNPGAKKVKREAIKDPRKSELVVTPRKIILDPGMSKQSGFSTPGYSFKRKDLSSESGA